MLELGREKMERREYTDEQDFLRQIDWCATHQAKPGLKNILKGSAGQTKSLTKIKKSGGRIQIRRGHLIN